MNMNYTLLAAFLLLATQAGQCGDKTAAVAPTASTAAAGETGGFSGKVTETMNAGDYTYLQVDTGPKKVWIAAPKFTVKVGDAASIKQGMPMPNYHSKVLNRDFDVVYFTDRVVLNGKAPALQQPSAELPTGHPPIPGVATVPSMDLSGIKKAKGGKTIEEIYAEKTKLSGHPVTVRGKVVKYNSAIMGKNWLHIKDGTGAEGSNDLLATTSADVKVGDTVLVTGRVSLNKDFGANYKYAVMIEEAEVAVEQ